MAIPIKRPAPPAPVQAQQTASKKISFAQIPESKGHRILLYGTGGIGKSTLSCLAPGPVAFIDADESLGVLKSQLKEMGIELPKIVSINNWESLRLALQSEGWDSIKTIVIDTITMVEQWASDWVIKNVPHEKGAQIKIKRIEDYGFGKGYQHIYDTFLGLLGDLEKHNRAGRNVILIAHECTSSVPNPRGDDYLRYEPRLQNPGSGKGSIRHKIKEWADHALFLGYDVVVDEKGIAQGQGTRTLYTAELPFCMAKSRTTNEQYDIIQGQSPWENIIK